MINEKVYIPKIKDTLGVKRIDMPQIVGKDYEAYKKFLNSNNIKLTALTVKASSLKPIQKEFDKKKVMNFIDAMSKGLEDKPLLVSKDNYIVDGHHRWLARKNLNDDVKIIKANVDINKLLQISREFPKVKFSESKEDKMIPVSVKKVTDLKIKVPKGYLKMSGFGLVNAKGEMFADKNGEPILWKSKATANMAGEVGLMPTAKFIKITEEKDITMSDKEEEIKEEVATYSTPRHTFDNNNSNHTMGATDSLLAAIRGVVSPEDIVEEVKDDENDDEDDDETVEEAARRKKAPKLKSDSIKDIRDADRKNKGKNKVKNKVKPKTSTQNSVGAIRDRAERMARKR
jgi:hypothetical protein